MDLVELLKEGKVEEFNAQRSRRGKLDLFSADLAGAKMVGVDLSNTNLQYADLSGADLTDAVLARADLSGADLTGATLEGCIGLKSKWREAYLGQADLRDVDLSGADLSEAELDGANCSGARFIGSRLKEASLPGADLTGADLSEARLSQANLTGAKMTKAHLKEARLDGADLTGANLMEAELTRIQGAGVVLVGTELAGARLVSADLTGANLTDALVTGADFTRADLTGAVLDGVALDEATFREAVVDPVYGADTAPKAPEPAALLIEEPSVAIGHDAVCVVWENAETDGKPRLRVLAGKLGRRVTAKAQALPVPTDLVLARTVSRGPEGFVIMLLVERPGGVAASIFKVSTNGELKAGPTFKLPYSPAVRPLMLCEGEHVHLYGISREGPGVHLHRISPEGLDRVFATGMPTARGFASAHTPVVLSKGGVMVPLSPRGKGEPVRAPAGFPGRTCGAAETETGLVVAWAERERKGLFTAQVRQGQAPESDRSLPKELIGGVDAGADAKGAWIVYTLEGKSAREQTTAWCMRLGDAKAALILEEDDRDVDAVTCQQSEGHAWAVLTMMDGSVEVRQLGSTSVRRQWRAGGG